MNGREQSRTFTPRSDKETRRVSYSLGPLPYVSLERERDPAYYGETLHSGLRGIPLFRQTEPITKTPKSCSSSVPALNLDPSNASTFTDTKLESPALPSPPLRSVLKSTPKLLEPFHSLENAGKFEDRERARVSFSGHDQVLLCNLDEETPLAEAQRSWTVCKRRSRASHEEQEERHAEEEELDKASAYPQVSRFDMVVFPRDMNLIPVYNTPRIGDQSASVDPRGYRHRERRRRPGLPRLTAVGRRGKRREFIAEPFEHPFLGTKHRHRHGFTSCEHGFLDPMDCTCDDPKKTIHAEGECQECGSARTQLTDDKDASDTERDEYASWWRKLGRKITF
ncbi:hypothetical protein Dda_5683 [Drechslerella dactyloides]|uniref:Uncharacterized protein n=1 Tax=Drechslerella dactyloides TaxID=74499 RepID=A0AAD6J0Y5_DREDA|nr:hypothetical protein Dda_5683 [Drechslerella dactyloides]